MRFSSSLSLRQLIGVPLFSLLLIACPVSAQEVTDQQVLDKMDQLKQVLMGSLQGNNWESRPNKGGNLAQEAGETALVLYALLAAGEDPQKNTKLMQVIQWLEEQEINGNYAVALRAHVWAKLPPRYLDMLEVDAEALVTGLRPTGDVSYYLGEGGTPDNSNTQYNMLGVWEAAKRGIEFSGDYWERIENYFLSEQQADGGWGYRSGPGSLRYSPYGSMVAAGLTCLFISNDYLHTHEYKEPGAGEKIKTYQAIQKGLGWFQQNFDATKVPGNTTGIGRDYPYYMVGVERVGVASGYKYFNNIDWYKAGAAHMIKQKIKADQHSGNNVKNAFKLVFLAGGRKPVMINKLKVEGMRWDNRPRDIAKLTLWTSDESEKGLLWQVIESTREAKDFMDAPILYLASDQAFEPDASVKTKIKQYLNAGGLLFTTSDAGSTAFDVSIEELAKELYPGYTWKQLPANHFIYNLVYQTDANKTPLWGIHNGVRWLFVHSGRDIAWSLHAGEVASEINDWQTMANLFHYATERGRVRPKLAQHYPVLKSGANAKALTVARVKYEGNWNPEPAAWEIGGVLMRNEAKVSPSETEVELNTLGSTSQRLAHLIGTGQVELSEAQISEIQSFINSGGTLLVEAAGGDPAFFMAMRRELSKLGEFTAMDPGHEMFQGTSFGGFDTTKVGYRSYRSYRTKTPQRTPSMMNIKINDRPAVILSGDDLSNAMLDQPVWGVYGYNHTSACKLMANILLYANR